MHRFALSYRALLMGVAIVSALPWGVTAAQGMPDPAKPESVTISAGKRYQAGALHRWFAGNTYRDLWVMPIRVPILDTRVFAGGLHATKEGGGMQTKSLRLESADGTEYVFRLSDKTATGAPGALKDTPADRIFQDEVSAQHPAAAPMSAAIAKASGVLHPTAVLMFMADDSALGKFREEFAGRLGMIEEYPNVPESAPGFGGATKIIDSEELLKLLNSDARQHIDPRSFLAARLTDFLINDNDRHSGNWKWARLDSGSKTEWVPIARDRDHAFVSYDGMLMRVASVVMPTLVSFGSAPNVPGLTQPRGFDARLLAGLDKPVWDSVAREVQSRITDSVIDAVATAMPLEYQAAAPRISALLKQRRAALVGAADQYYRLLAERVQVHGTDSSDRAVITRLNDGVVEVRLESGGKPFFSRRFDARETSEILVYLHGGNDVALINGEVERSITVRVIGGNGSNTLVDSSAVAGNRRPTHLYDIGLVAGVSYGPDTLFERLPWEKTGGKLAPPGPNSGGALQPIVGLSSHRGVGLAPRVGVIRYSYGFGQRPYSSMVRLEGEYASAFHGGKIGITADKRLESSPIHFNVAAHVSDFEVINYGGLGNQVISSVEGGYFDVRQRQWSFHPAVAVAIGSRMDVSIGPTIQHSTTHGAPNGFLAVTRPYGSGDFDQAGVRVSSRYEWRTVAEKEEHTHHRVLAELSGVYAPAALDVQSAFETAALSVAASLTLPLPTRPLLVVRSGGKKLFGRFPFHDAATLGGEGSMRYMDTQRYAGDAVVYGTSELRIPLARFKFVVPLRAGLVGLAEAGRVYDKGSSPGGWHTQTGEGIWFGLGDASPVVTLTRTTERGHGGLKAGFGLNF